MRPVPRPRLEPAGRFAGGWTVRAPARLRLGLGIALVGALAIAWFALGSRPTPGGRGAPAATAAASMPTTATTTAPRPGPDPPRATSVPPWVPRAIASTCRAHTTTAPTVVVVVDCAPGRGVATLRYTELAAANALDAAYDGRRPSDHAPRRGPPHCALGGNDERAWSNPSATAPNRAAGRYRCTRRGGAARIEWTDDATRVLAVATRADGDLRSLYVWWTAVPGPVEGPTAR